MGENFLPADIFRVITRLPHDTALPKETPLSDDNGLVVLNVSYSEKHGNLELSA